MTYTTTDERGVTATLAFTPDDPQPPTPLRERGPISILVGEGHVTVTQPGAGTLEMRGRGTVTVNPLGEIIGYSLSSDDGRTRPVVSPLAEVQAMIDRLERRDREMLRVYMVAHFDEDGSRRPRLHGDQLPN